jgi:DNA-binding beta-propeller fold protein YncE
MQLIAYFPGTFVVRVAAIVATLTTAAIVLFIAPPAHADFEQVGVFGQEPHPPEGNAPLQNAQAAAVNFTGAGGVEPGSLYVVGRSGRVLRYGATGEFREAWGWGIAKKGPGNEFVHCGPAISSLPECQVSPVAAQGGEEPGHFSQLWGVAVDQATGYVYVNMEAQRPTLQQPQIKREQNLIEVFSADGSELITRFADAAPGTQTFDESPERVHTFRARGLAVDRTGKVYLGDGSLGDSRVMCFRPQTAGDYEHYVYCGRSSDIDTGIEASMFTQLSVDDAGHLFGAADDAIIELSLASPATPLCAYSEPKGGLQGVTVNVDTGEVFAFNGKDRKLHRFGSCTEGKFTEAQVAVRPAPDTHEMNALAFNPMRVWGPGRPAGVLYGIDAENHFTLEPPIDGSGDIFAPAVESPPSIISESVKATGTTESILQAEIDPNGYGTDYVFQYLTDAEYEQAGNTFSGAAEAPQGGGQIGGLQVGTAIAPLQGLAPDTAYRFRVIATSSCAGEAKPRCEVLGEPASFRTFPSVTPGLPDDRAYELVSPSEKQGGEVFAADPSVASCLDCKPPGAITFGGRFPMQSAPDGDAVSYAGFPFSASEGASVNNEYLSHRSDRGWQTTALSPALQGNAAGHLAFNEILTQGLIAQDGSSPSLSAGAPSGISNFYLQSTATPAALSPLLTEAPPNRVETSFELSYGGHSADFSHQLFAANDALTAETSSAPAAPLPGSTEANLYDWQDGQLALVNVLPGNAAVAGGAGFASIGPDTHAISADGSRIYWEDGSGQLYVREDGVRTLEIADHGKFLAASSDGAIALLDDGCLYDLQVGACQEDLTQGEGGFRGIAGLADDGSAITQIYFVDAAALPGVGANQAGEVALPGENNLYSWHEGVLSFIATLAPEASGSSERTDWSADPSKRTAEASPNGRFLAFVSEEPLTGYPNIGPCKNISATDEANPAPCMQVFLYDATTARLFCASCSPTGEAPLGPATLRRLNSTPAWLPQPRYLTDTGRLYFDTSSRLSPFDVNGPVDDVHQGVEDVYEFVPFGSGTCQRQSGCVALISTGAGDADSNLLAVDQSGKNVFFTTRESLLVADSDELLDLYDAREDGGIPSETETQRPECQGESCQPALAGPNDTSPASSTFKGAGNVSESSRPKACPRGKVRRHGKCVRKHRRKNHKPTGRSDRRGGN